MKQLEKSAVNLDQLFSCSLFFSKDLKVHSSSSPHLCWALIPCLVLEAEDRERERPLLPTPTVPRTHVWLRARTCHHFVTLLSYTDFYIPSFFSNKAWTCFFRFESWGLCLPSSVAGRHIMKWDVPSETEVRNLNCVASHKPTRSLWGAPSPFNRCQDKRPIVLRSL